LDNDVDAALFDDDAGAATAEDDDRGGVATG
jgi:hypothetical protein